jgi:hypothetical protein
VILDVRGGGLPCREFPEYLIQQSNGASFNLDEVMHKIRRRRA